MGAVCSGGILKRSRKANEIEHEKTFGISGKLKSVESFGKHNHCNESYDHPDEIDVCDKAPQSLYDSGELNLPISGELKPSSPRILANKAPSFFEKAGIASLEKAVEVIDTLGSSMTNLNSGGFTVGMVSKANKISVLAFEVANTIAKGANLVQSLSEGNIQFLKKEILNSEGVQKLVSTDMNELLRIAAADKREEFDVFSREVIRFGNRCKDPQWHNLNRFFLKLDSDPEIHKQRNKEAEMIMQELTTLAQHTSELYHELQALDKFELDYQQKLEEAGSLQLPRKGESLTMLHNELKQQRKLVKNLRKKSLWSKSMEQVVEKLVDIVMFIHEEISVAFGEDGLRPSCKVSANKPDRLGPAGLALHYANIITQIDNIASRPASLPANVRDALYNGLPPAIKIPLRSRIHKFNSKEKLTSPQIKAEMAKTLDWLVPMATDTTKAHQGFGWVGEWANTCNEFDKKSSMPSNLIRMQTLYHADKRKVESYILNLVTWLHRLVSLVRYRDNEPKPPPAYSPTPRGNMINAKSLSKNAKTGDACLSLDDRFLLEEVMNRRRLLPGLSKSQELATGKNKRSKVWAPSRSTGNSPRRGSKHKKASVLDILDGLDSKFSFSSWE